jgi:hypothetical protein
MKRFFKKIFNWELWSDDLVYAPLGIVWLYYSLKARAFWFFTPVNPSLYFGGFEGVSKKEMYDQLPAWCYPKTFFVKAGQSSEEIKRVIQTECFTYPFVVKPDVAMQGVLFRVIKNEDEWQRYHAAVPVDYLIQAYIELPLEFSVFYIRYPGEAKGKITGFVMKDYLHVTGDGSKTLEQLVMEDPRAMHRVSEMKRKHKDNWKMIPAKNEKYYLSVAGNHNRGARFVNLNKEIDQQLSDVFDRLNNESNNLYYGRYDMKCASIEELKKGNNFWILEFNGAGAAPQSIYDCGMRYGKALAVIIDHWHDLYKIGKINHKKGVPYWSFLKGHYFLKRAKKDFKHLQKIDASLH